MTAKPGPVARLLLAVLLVGFLPASWACSGRVVGVTDGDTIKVLCEGIETKVRLNQIDAPERSQAFGSKSKEVLSNLVFNRTVRLDVVDTDRYGRSVATVWVGDMDANREMVCLGFAWAYRKYLRDDSLLAVENDAKTARRGLWSDANPVAPWDFRKVKRKS